MDIAALTGSVFFICTQNEYNIITYILFPGLKILVLFQINSIVPVLFAFFLDTPN